MSLTIPLSAATTNKPAFRIALPIGAAVNSNAVRGGALNSSAAKNQVLLAVAVAASFTALERALHVAKEARDDPSAVVGKVDAVQLAPTLEAVVRVQEDRGQAAEASDNLTAVARAIGADVALAATAVAVLERSKANAGDKTSAAIDSSLDWVACLNIDLLDRCNKAVREQLIDLIPDQQTRLQRMEDRLTVIEARLKTLEDSVSGKGSLPSPASAAVRKS